MTVQVAARSTPVRAEGPALVVLPPEETTDHGGISPGTPLLGLPLLRRTVLAAERAGFGQILVVCRDPAAVQPLVEGTPAVAVRVGEPVPPFPPGRVVLLAPDVLAQPPWLRSLGHMPMESGALMHNGEGVAILEASQGFDLAALLSRVQRDGGHGNSRGPDGSGMVRLRGPQDVSKAEGWLLRALIKENESFMSRRLERPISLAITRRLVGTRISPNTMTAVSLGLGLLGAPFFLSSAATLQLSGALLFWLHSVLDGCDGELARLRFQESRWGGLFDFWGDNVVHAAVFLCMGAGWALAVRAAWPLLVGAAAAGGTLGSAVFVTRHIMRGTPGGGPLFTSVAPARASRLSRLLDAVGQRDFIYAVIVFSALGKAAWFLALAALGAPMFFLLMLWSAWADSRRVEGCP